jgi:hypothetical protein
MFGGGVNRFGGMVLAWARCVRSNVWDLAGLVVKASCAHLCIAMMPKRFNSP